MRDFNMTKHIVACIQARMGSTRLPGKVVMPIQGVPVIEVIHRRLRASALVDQIIVATADTPINQAVADCANAFGIPFYRGSENDVVDRLYQAEQMFHGTAFLKITADCPLVDPEIVDQIVQMHLDDPSVDYISNVVPPTYPDGFDIELLSAAGSKKLWERTRGDAFLSEWFSHDIRQHPEIYKTSNLALERDLSHIRLTVDYPEDFALIQEIFSRLAPHGEIFHMQDVLDLLEREPILAAMNASYVRDQAYKDAVLAKANGCG